MGLTKPVIIFLLLATLYVMSLSYAPYSFQFLLKVLPILILLFLCLLCLGGKIRILLSLSIIASGTGDVFLASSIEHGFILGLASFLTAHVLYIISFFYSGHFHRPTLERALGVLIVVIFSTVMAVSVLPNTQELLVPVSVYLLVLSTMAISALLYNMNKTTIIGAACFLASDALLAQSVFNTPLPLSDLLVMTTYYSAQLLIVVGMIKYVHSNPPKKSTR